MHVNWKHVAMALAALPFVAIFVAWIGFFNVGASSGHWRITEWFLHLAMRSAVRTYALAVDVPERLPEDGIQPAAGHFARGCSICHGAPGEPRSPAALRMLPQPPDLATVVGVWSDAELFRIVKHGIRFTGMPAWPTQDRDDEIWAMVAFLRELPVMDGEKYRNLAYGDGPATAAGSPRNFEQALSECSRCHGAYGLGRSALTPVLAGQNEIYLLESLHAYADGRRPSGMMSLPATAVGSDTFIALARHFSALPPLSDTVAAFEDAALMQRGAEIATHGIPAKRVPACLGCHAPEKRNPNYPILAGQPADYVEQQLRLFRGQLRGGTPYNHLMVNIAKDLTDPDIEALAVYFATAQQPRATTVP